MKPADSLLERVDKERARVRKKACEGQRGGERGKVMREGKKGSRIKGTPVQSSPHPIMGAGTRLLLLLLDGFHFKFR